jgi:ABC-2 type transport system permease protein
LGAQVLQGQLAATGDLNAGEEAALVRLSAEFGGGAAGQGTAKPLIAIQSQQAAAPEEGVSLLTYIAPGMAVFFLMYTVTQGGRSILMERQQGTLARLLVSPTRAGEVLGGKTMGIFFSGAAQMGILILGSTLLFGLNWGGAWGVTVLILATVTAASGWGLLLAALARTPGQVSGVGTGLMLIFGVMGGSFFSLPADSIVAQLGKITPNAWALEGFTILGSGGSLADITIVLLALILMAAVLFAIAAAIFRRRLTMAA